MKISYTYILFSLFLAFLPGCELIHDDLPETRADGEPVYIMALVDDGALIKKYAMVDLQDYTKVAAADTVEDTWKEFVERYGAEGQGTVQQEAETVSVRLNAPVETAVIDGNSYVYLQTVDGIYRISVDGNEETLFLENGDWVELVVYSTLRDGFFEAELSR